MIFDATTVSLPEVDALRPLITTFLHLRFRMDNLPFCMTERTASRIGGSRTGAWTGASAEELSLLLFVVCPWCWPYCWTWTDLVDIVVTLVNREILTTSLNDGPLKVMTLPWSEIVLALDCGWWSELLKLAGSLASVLWEEESIPKNESKKKSTLCYSAAIFVSTTLFDDSTVYIIFRWLFGRYSVIC